MVNIILEYHFEIVLPVLRQCFVTPHISSLTNFRCEKNVSWKESLGFFLFVQDMCSNSPAFLAKSLTSWTPYETFRIIIYSIIIRILTCESLQVELICIGYLSLKL